ncbi:MAG: Ppx/GppA phosphatase family protein [Bacteroidota bacterium]
MSRIAVIDCGTNTFHLLIVSYDSKTIKVLHQEKQVVKIGQGGINNKLITTAAQGRAIKALENFKAKIDKYQVSEIFAFATSAFRNAENGQPLRDQVQHITSIDLNIIDGMQEAELIYGGVRGAMEIGNGPVLVMDIGGGSVECIIGNAKQIFWKQSFEIGAQRLMDLFHRNDPITREEVKTLREYLNFQLIDLFEAVEKLRPKTLIGSSGTFDTLSEIYCNHMSLDIDQSKTETPLTLSAFKMIHQQLLNCNREERLAIPGMIEMRVDMIVVASCIIDLILRKIPIEKIRVSRYALKEGVLARIVEGE